MVWTRGKAKVWRKRLSCDQGEGEEYVDSKQENAGRV